MSGLGRVGLLVIVDENDCISDIIRSIENSGVTVILDIYPVDRQRCTDWMYICNCGQSLSSTGRRTVFPLSPTRPQTKQW